MTSKAEEDEEEEDGHDGDHGHDHDEHDDEHDDEDYDGCEEREPTDHDMVGANGGLAAENGKKKSPAASPSPSPSPSPPPPSGPHSPPPAPSPSPSPSPSKPKEEHDGKGHKRGKRKTALRDCCLFGKVGPRRACAARNSRALPAPRAPAYDLTFTRSSAPRAPRALQASSVKWDFALDEDPDWAEEHGDRNRGIESDSGCPTPDNLEVWRGKCHGKCPEGYERTGSCSCNKESSSDDDGHGGGRGRGKDGKAKRHPRGKRADDKDEHEDRTEHPDEDHEHDGDDDEHDGGD